MMKINLIHKLKTEVVMQTSLNIVLLSLLSSLLEFGDFFEVCILDVKI
jgi:hypothetical protein